MNKQASSKKREQVQKAKLETILAGRMFYLIGKDRHEVKGSTIAQFDSFADALCEEITNVDRAVWDVFARWRFINFLLAEGVLALQREEGGTILLIETEEKTSSAEVQAEEKTSEIQQVEAPPDDAMPLPHGSIIGELIEAARLFITSPPAPPDGAA